MLVAVAYIGTYQRVPRGGSYTHTHGHHDAKAISFIYLYTLRPLLLFAYLEWEMVLFAPMSLTVTSYAMQLVTLLCHGSPFLFWNFLAFAGVFPLSFSKFWSPYWMLFFSFLFTQLDFVFIYTNSQSEDVDNQIQISDFTPSFVLVFFGSKTAQIFIKANFLQTTKIRKKRTERKREISFSFCYQLKHLH